MSYLIGPGDLNGDDVTDEAIHRAAEKAINGKLDQFAVNEKEGTWSGHLDVTFPGHLVRGHWYVDGPIIDILVEDP